MLKNVSLHGVNIPASWFKLTKKQFVDALKGHDRLVKIEGIETILGDLYDEVKKKKPNAEEVSTSEGSEG